jgi:hypothetical protein
LVASHWGSAKQALQASTYTIKPKNNPVFKPFDVSIKSGSTAKIELGGILEFNWPGEDDWDVYQAEQLVASHWGSAKQALQAGTYTIKPKNNPVFKPFEMPRPMSRDINVNPFHDRNRFVSGASWFYASASSFETVPRTMGEQSFSHLAAGTIFNAESWITFLHGLCPVRLSLHSPAGCARGNTTSFASEGRPGASQRKRTVAARAPSNCATIKPGVSDGRMPANVSVNPRASVTAGLAKEVEAVNQ